jgi:hypothetical protein
MASDSMKIWGGATGFGARRRRTALAARGGRSHTGRARSPQCPHPPNASNSAGRRAAARGSAPHQRPPQVPIAERRAAVRKVPVDGDEHAAQVLPDRYHVPPQRVPHRLVEGVLVPPAAAAAAAKASGRPRRGHRAAGRGDAGEAGAAGHGGHVALEQLRAGRKRAAGLFGATPPGVAASARTRRGSARAPAARRRAAAAAPATPC